MQSLHRSPEERPAMGPFSAGNTFAKLFLTSVKFSVVM